MQIGNGAALARRLKLPVACDFYTFPTTTGVFKTTDDGRGDRRSARLDASHLSRRREKLLKAPQNLMN